jgi:hypothetical protein
MGGTTKGTNGVANEKNKAENQIEKLLALAQHGIEFFHDRDNTGFARACENGRIVVAPIDSKDFKLVLRRRYYGLYQSGPNDESMKTAIRTLEARACFDGAQCEVALRVAEHDGCIYLNLARDDGSIVEISPSGWRIVNDAPVRFWRAPGMQPLPIPFKNGSIAALAKVLNLAGKADFILTVAWLLGALSKGPYPIAAFVGEQGTAKSTATRLLRKLIDPNKALLRSLPREERDLAVTGRNSHVLTFDNLSGLSAWISDALAKVATGGGFSCRELHTNDGEFIFDTRRPIIMNGIDDFATRGDLVDRSIFLRLSPSRTLIEKRRLRSTLDSSKRPPASSGHYLTPSPTASAIQKSSKHARGWRISPNGLRPAKLIFWERAFHSRARVNRHGAPEISSAPMKRIAETRPKPSSMPTPLDRPFYLSWTAERAGPERRRTCFRGWRSWSKKTRAAIRDGPKTARPSAASCDGSRQLSAGEASILRICHAPIRKALGFYRFRTLRLPENL